MARVTLPHLDRPICEPVELGPGAPVRVVRVRQGREALPSEPFPHFHDVYELVLFGDVDGQFAVEGRRYDLQSRSIAYVPSMRQHDFALAGGQRDWVLVQIDAAAGDALARKPGLALLAQSFCARPAVASYRRLRALAEWLADIDPADPLALPLAELLLRAATRAPRVEGVAVDVDPNDLKRLRPAIDRLRAAPAAAHGAQRAAAACALSTAYFSRRFKQLIGLSWSDYVRAHRLHLASRRLLESDEQVLEIAEDLGFSSASQFGELFKRRFGMAPKRYRQAAHAQDPAKRRP